MQSTLGGYGEWVSKLVPDQPSLSFRHDRWTDVDDWREIARKRTLDCLACPDTGGQPDVTVEEIGVADGVRVERHSWQLPYGPRSEAFFLRPVDAAESLPGVLALHDHGGDKYHGKRKITRAPGAVTDHLVDHRAKYYNGFAWANRLAKRGYAVFVPDGFTFGSRRLDPHSTAGVEGVPNPGPVTADASEIAAYNEWASDYESVAARSLLCAGTTFPGAMVADDRTALDVLCAHPAVDETRVGCAGLSGGGLRTAYLGGLDRRIRSAVCVGMMTTWRDFVERIASRHTWMVYPPLLARDMDYPDVFSMRAPNPTLVLHNESDALFSSDEMHRADEHLSAVFEKADAADRYECHYYAGPHKFDDEMQRDAFEWLDRTLAAMDA